METHKILLPTRVIRCRPVNETFPICRIKRERSESLPRENSPVYITILKGLKSENNLESSKILFVDLSNACSQLESKYEDFVYVLEGEENLANAEDWISEMEKVFLDARVKCSHHTEAFDKKKVQ